MENNHTLALPLWELAGCGEGEHAGSHPGPGPAGRVTQSAVGEAWRPHHQTSAAESRECLWKVDGALKGEHTDLLPWLYTVHIKVLFLWLFRPSKE